MEYENLKKIQKKKYDVDIATDAGDQPQHIIKRSAGSTTSVQSTPYQTFCLDEDLDGVSARGSLQRQSEPSPMERRRATSANTTYSYPKVPVGIQGRKSHQEDEAGYAYATTESVAPKRKLKSQSTSQIPDSSPLAITDQPLPLPPTLIMGNSPAVQMSKHPGAVKRISDTITIYDQPLLPKPDRQTSTTKPTQISISGFQMNAPSATAGVKPLVMKMLPLYFCMDDGKVYADRNAASVPTHHLIEVNMNAEMNTSMIASAKPQRGFSHVS